MIMYVILKHKLVSIYLVNDNSSFVVSILQFQQYVHFADLCLKPILIPNESSSYMT